MEPLDISFLLSLDAAGTLYDQSISSISVFFLAFEWDPSFTKKENYLRTSLTKDSIICFNG